MNRALEVGEIAKAISGLGFFARQVHNPATNTVSDVKPAGIACLFVSVHIGKADEASPNDNGIVLGIGAATTGEIKMVAPTMVHELRSLMLVQPFQARFSFLKVLRIAGGSVSNHVARSHVAPSFG